MNSFPPHSSTPGHTPGQCYQQPRPYPIGWGNTPTNAYYGYPPGNPYWRGSPNQMLMQSYPFSTPARSYVASAWNAPVSCNPHRLPPSREPWVLPPPPPPPPSTPPQSDTNQGLKNALRPKV